MSEERLIEEVNDTISKTVKKNKEELDMALIKPLKPNYQFSSNGLYLYIGKMGSGKTLEIIKHILITDKISGSDDKSKDCNTYYNLIVFCSTSQGLDKTVQTFLPKIKTPVAFVPDTSILGFLKRHIRRKKKYYAIVSFINSELKKTNEEMKRIFAKHGLQNRGKKLKYIAQKLLKYNCTNYPLNLLLVLDDFANHPLMRKPDSELVRIITKGRHYNITSILAVQTTKFVVKNCKRMCSDVVLWKGLSEDDWIDLMRELPHSFDSKQLWEEYHNLQNPHDHLEMHVYANSYKFVKGS